MISDHTSCSGELVKKKEVNYSTINLLTEIPVGLIRRTK